MLNMPIKSRWSDEEMDVLRTILSTTRPDGNSTDVVKPFNKMVKEVFASRGKAYRVRSDTAIRQKIRGLRRTGANGTGM